MEVTNMEKEADQFNQDYKRIEHAICFLEEHHPEQPNLKEIAASVNLSEYHFQRLFTRWVGISPKRFMQYLTKEHAKQLLDESTDLLNASIDSGLSGPGRLHDLIVTCDAVTPGEYKRWGEDLEIRYGFHASPFGELLVAITQRGISNLMFVQDDDRKGTLSALIAYWPAAEVQVDQDATGEIATEIMRMFQRRITNPLRLYLKGTNFQIKVWEALLHIPSGSLVAYKDIAIYIGMPGVARAVGNAVSRNPIPVLIPCHRVIRKTGDFGHYRWGVTRKKALLGWEMAKRGRVSSKGAAMVNA
jgi:AraC family transcriptional regulator of adaptative response/methylated-DNA-[protein]-cysteine methyltransferase